jgi:hypothetical protein
MYILVKIIDESQSFVRLVENLHPGFQLCHLKEIFTQNFYLTYFRSLLDNLYPNFQLCRLNNVLNICAADFALLNLPKGKSLGPSKPATNS